MHLWRPIQCRHFLCLHWNLQDVNRIVYWSASRVPMSIPIGKKGNFRKKPSQLCYWLGLSLSRKLLFQSITLGLFTPKCWLSISFTPEFILFWGKTALVTKPIHSSCLIISWRESRLFNLFLLFPFFFSLYSAPSQGSSEKPTRDN